MSETLTPSLDRILGRHSVHFNYNKAETRQLLQALIKSESDKAVEAFAAELTKRVVAHGMVGSSEINYELRLWMDK